MITEYSMTLENKTKSELILFIKQLQDMLKEKDKEIESLKEIKKIADSKITDLPKMINYDKLQSEIWVLQTKLKEKDKEIEHWKNGFERELEDNRKNTYELLKQDLIIRQKDKQIDLMAKAFKQDDVRTVEEIKQYFERKASR